MTNMTNILTQQQQHADAIRTAAAAMSCCDRGESRRQRRCSPRQRQHRQQQRATAVNAHHSRSIDRRGRRIAGNNTLSLLISLAAALAAVTATYSRHYDAFTAPLQQQQQRRRATASATATLTRRSNTAATTLLLATPNSMLDHDLVLDTAASGEALIDALSLASDAASAAERKKRTDGPNNNEEDDEDAKEQERREVNFDLFVGKALDTLRDDYPDILTMLPDFSIYDKNLEIVDPSGVTVHGLSVYKNTFRLLQGVIQVFYCPSRSGITFRMCYDKARRNIRIHWNCCVVPREIFGGLRSTLHIDGISVYELDRATGNITQHRIEHLLMNDQPLRPKEGVIAAIQDQAVTVPNLQYFKHSDNKAGPHNSPANIVANFELVGAPTTLNPFQHASSSSLFAFEGASSSDGAGGSAGSATSSSSNDASASPVTSSATSTTAAAPAAATVSSTTTSAQHISTIDAPEYDWRAALEKKNKSRKKFGLKPLSSEEFLEIEAQVEQMSAEQRRRQADLASLDDKMKTKDNKNDAAGSKDGNNWLTRLFGDTLQDTCESNYDCDRPEICCDFGFKKICCSSGSMILSQRGMMKPAMVPVPVDVQDDLGRRPGGGGGAAWRNNNNPW